MADLVQLRLEESVEELQQLQLLGIFSASEVKSVIRKRKHLEYKLQRQIKAKEDFLKYIQYEINLLDLFMKRQSITENEKKRNQIFHSIVSRINRLFRFVEYRHQEDINLWLTHINFCKKVKRRNTVSAIFMRMLQVHSRSPSAWIAAAKWEFKENKSSETARDLMLRGIRFLPDSKLLYQECFRLELEYADIIRKRSKVLGLTDVQKEAHSDEILSGGIAEIIYRNAIKAIDDIDFHLSFISICESFDFTTDIRDRIITDIKNTHQKEERMWNFFANRHLKINNQQKISIESLKSCFAVFDSGLEEVPTEKMLKYCVDTCLSKYSDYNFGQFKIQIRNYLLKTLKKGYVKGLVSEEIFEKWAQLSNGEEKEIVLSNGLKNFPTSIALWELHILHELKKNPSEKDIKHLFNEAIDVIPLEKSLPIWNLALDWLLTKSPTKALNVLKKPINYPSFELVRQMKPLYLELNAMILGVDEARKIYKEHSTRPPIIKEFFWKMFEIEKSQINPSIERLRRVLEDLIEQFGSSDVDVWLKLMELETHHKDGKVQSLSLIHWRAIKTLKPEYESQFITAETLIKTGRN